MRKLFQLLIAVVGTTSMNAQLGPYYQQYAKYKMDIDVNAEKKTYNGKQTITYTNNSPETLDVVYFHLYWNAFKPNSMMDQRVQSQGKNADGRLSVNGQSRLQSIPKGEEGAQNIHWIKQNGKSLKFEVQETIMKVYLDKPIQPNITIDLAMEWDAVIPFQIRRSGRDNREGVDMTMTQWYPKLAEYDYDGWATFDYIGREFHAPFADFDINIKIDKDYVVGAGGTLQNPNEVKGYSKTAKPVADKSKKVTWKWTASNILDFAWAADRDFSVETFDVPQGPKVNLVYQKNEKTKLWEQTPQYISRFFQIMNNKFGNYVYPSYSFVQGGDGGMEYGMCTMILGEAKSLDGLLGLMFHEGAHSWYQQMLATNESTKGWLDEGFTSYAENIVMHELFADKTKESHAAIGTLGGYRNFIKRGMEEPAGWLADHHDNGNAYTYSTYVKGELYLVQLGYIMGEQNLQKALKEYYDTWKMKHPSDRDFLHIAQKISGMDLKWFQHYWINTTKTINYGIKNVEYGDKETKITFENKGEVPMPIDFSVITSAGKVMNYQIPLNMTHTWKSQDAFGGFKTLEYWPWTQKEYTVTLPFNKSQLKTVVIDASQRLADIDLADNKVEVN